ncbi:hypothetical protein M422DRAFT_263037 [Sphaerobolus stellatus SS14]|uniref:Uncharacterized protein n=1 Tax=Sphaerobolus stellatus (strain SS14) TaxID=990650 RepID=A0A0C9TWS5_SPHS4|nr:hypothetical protein M422DRAFT_263037 [Sphaerobolus stellatus SS14]
MDPSTGYNDMSHLDTMVFLGTIFMGTYSLFFRIPISKALNKALERGVMPKEPTYIYCYKPQLNVSNDDLLSVKNCENIVSCFEAFKRFVPSTMQELLAMNMDSPIQESYEASRSDSPSNWFDDD